MIVGHLGLVIRQAIRYDEVMTYQELTPGTEVVLPHGYGQATFHHCSRANVGDGLWRYVFHGRSRYVIDAYPDQEIELA